MDPHLDTASDSSDDQAPQTPLSPHWQWVETEEEDWLSSAMVVDDWFNRSDTDTDTNTEYSDYEETYPPLSSSASWSRRPCYLLTIWEEWEDMGWDEEETMEAIEEKVHDGQEWYNLGLWESQKPAQTQRDWQGIAARWEQGSTGVWEAVEPVNGGIAVC